MADLGRGRRRGQVWSLWPPASSWGRLRCGRPLMDIAPIHTGARTSNPHCDIRRSRTEKSSSHRQSLDAILRHAILPPLAYTGAPGFKELLVLIQSHLAGFTLDVKLLGNSFSYASAACR